MDITNEQIVSEFQRQVYLCSGIGKNKMVEIINDNFQNENNRPIRQYGAYICIAYRYGHREGHSYLVDICGGIDTASARAEEEANERGGKYSVVVFAKHFETGDIEEVYEAKCPKHYTEGTNPSIPKN